MTQRVPDPHALEAARAAQKAVAPATVILFGSRATGKYRDDSDVDILVIDDQSTLNYSKIRAHHAARDYFRSCPPRFEVSVIGMTRKDFNRCKYANQHIAGQAARHGVIMSGERMNYSSHYDDNYPDHWPETLQRLRNVDEYTHQFNEMVDQEHWNQRMIGFSAQQAIENALKGWLSTYNDPRTYGHDIEELWSDVAEKESFTQPELARIFTDVNGLFEHTRYSDPANPGEDNNWLSDTTVVYRYGGTSYHMDHSERLALQEKLNTSIQATVERIHDISETSPNDVWRDVGRPWDP